MKDEVVYEKLDSLAATIMTQERRIKALQARVEAVDETLDQICAFLGRERTPPEPSGPEPDESCHGYDFPAKPKLSEEERARAETRVIFLQNELRALDGRLVKYRIEERELREELA